jgi:hypothetical protein
MSAYTDTQRKKLRDEIYLKNRVQIEGIAFAPDIFKHLDISGKYIEQVNILFAGDKHAHKDVEFPPSFLTPEGGYPTQLRWDRDSPISLVYEDGQYNLYDSGKVVIEKVQFVGRPRFYSLKTSDGSAMRTVAVDYGYGALFVAYSNECSLKDKGLDCLFCNINATKSLYGEAQGISWKTPQQVGETIAAGYKDGYSHLTVSGGFIAERREVEYYLDVAEAVQEYTGLEDFNGTACIGAPLDFSVFEKYKAAGFRTIATNVEIWNGKLFDVICPGKAQQCGGRRNWLNALDEELRVFGKHKVRTTFVAGLEPKQSLLEGIEDLTERGVVVNPSPWNVCVGSPLEGHRTPMHDWHWEIAEKTAALYKRYAFTWDELRDANASATMVPCDLFRLEAGIEAEETGQMRAAV